VNRAIQKANTSMLVRSVGDGDQALAYLSGAEPYANREEYPMPSLILLDLKMPRKSGLEVLAWIRQQSNLKRMPVVIFTSSKHDHDINRAYDLGANSYLVKPVGFEALQETIRQVDHYWAGINQAPAI
jgi:CheY-like chemotaxis protein